MLVRTNCWRLVATLMCACVSASAGLATEPIVQEFDGWKITIRPGASSLSDTVPPTPRPISAIAPAIKTGIQQVSLHQDAAAPKPSPVTHVAQPAIDGRPVIIPGESPSEDCCDPEAAVPPAGTVDPRYLARMYSEIYRSIPFNRAEYNANPSYRHDTAVEFLFGKMRPTVIHRGSTNVYHHMPAGYGVPYVYGGLGYAYPPLQLVVPGVGLRVHRSYAPPGP